MQEALISLFQMAKTSAVLERLRLNGVPYLSVMTDPTYGGVSASFALLGDLNIAEPGARAGFAGPNIIEQTIGWIIDKLPQNADHNHRHDNRDEVDRAKNIDTSDFLINK